jgi:hypothetical protein
VEFSASLWHLNAVAADESRKAAITAEASIDAGSAAGRKARPKRMSLF